MADITQEQLNIVQETADSAKALGQELSEDLNELTSTVLGLKSIFVSNSLSECYWPKVVQLGLDDAKLQDTVQSQEAQIQKIEDALGDCIDTGDSTTTISKQVGALRTEIRLLKNYNKNLEILLKEAGVNLPNSIFPMKDPITGQVTGA